MNLSNEHKYSRRLWLERKDKHLFKGLEVCKLKTQLSNAQSGVKKQGKPRILTVRSTFLRRIGPAFLDSVWVQGGLDNGCQVL